MKNIFLILAVGVVVILGSCNNEAAVTESGLEAAENNDAVLNAAQSGDLQPEYLTAQAFREKVWDYEKNPEQWVYNGELPCVVDFYADWCKPCKMVAPIMDDLADYYEGRVLIYKVNTDDQKELASVFQVRSIPSILFAPIDGKPAMQAGAMSKEDYIRIIDEFILKTNEKNNTKTES